MREQALERVVASRLNLLWRAARHSPAERSIYSKVSPTRVDWLCTYPAHFGQLVDKMHATLKPTTRVLTAVFTPDNTDEVSPVAIRLGAPAPAIGLDGIYYGPHHRAPSTSTMGA